MGFKLFIAAAVLLICCNVARAELSYDYYKDSCPRVQEIVRNVMANYSSSNQRVGASILRLHFHDCFVEGCDGSLLIDSTASNVAEKDFPGNNPSLKGFDVIDAVKAMVEKSCPGVVSCADILAYAARDGVSLLGGPFWKIRAGRKDGRVSMIGRAAQFLAPPFFNITQLVAAFAVKNLTKEDLVFLSGGHTIGLSLCSSFNTRLYNFTGKGDQDPSMNVKFAKELKSQCPALPATSDPLVSLEPTPFKVDTKYFKEIIRKRGLLTSDQVLLDDPITAAALRKSAHSQEFFFAEFIKSMIKMSEIEVKTGSQGEIRKKCRVIN